jgi:uncharacterized protein HemX
MPRQAIINAPGALHYRAGIAKDLKALYRYAYTGHSAVTGRVPQLANQCH